MFFFIPLLGFTLHFFLCLDFPLHFFPLPSGDGKKPDRGELVQVRVLSCMHGEVCQIDFLRT